MIGGMVSSTTLTLVVIPVLYFVWNRRAMSSGPAIETTFARPTPS
jgi:Cu/Ag efflux pump CusA